MMSKVVSKLLLGLSITSAIGINAFSFSPSALAASCDVSNISLGGFKANDCQGSFSGNDKGENSSLLTDLNNGLFSIGANVTWDIIGSSDDKSLDITTSQGSTGTWSLSQAIVDSGLSTFAISLKSGKNHSVYLFQDIDFSVTGLEGIFNTIGVATNKKGKAQDISHASLFKASYATAPEMPKVQSVPEPATAAALGLFALAGLRGLKKKSLV